MKIYKLYIRRSQGGRESCAYTYSATAAKLMLDKSAIPPGHNTALSPTATARNAREKQNHLLFAHPGNHYSIQ